MQADAGQSPPYFAPLALATCLGVAAACGAAVWAPASFGADPKHATCTLESGRIGSVARVIDGETLIMDDGSEVRLIGALAPHPPSFSDPENWPPQRTAAKALKTLVLGQTVQLAFAGRRVDRYGRALAHAFTVRNGERLWVQGEMLRHGHARAYGLPGNFACIDELLAHEKLARAENAGLWANSAYRVRPAVRSRDLMRLRNSYQIVEGVVREVADVRGRIYLNFGDNWRDDFTAGIAAGAFRQDQAWREELKALTGKAVRVRGWIERRNGPYIEVSDRGQIEAVSDNPDALRMRRQPAAPEDAQTSSQRTPDDGNVQPAAPYEDKAKRPAQDAPGALNL